MTEPASFIKHLSKSPIQRLMINNFNKRLIDILRTTKCEKILDAGCGEGFVIVNLARNKVGKTYEGIDNSESAIRRGRKMYPTLNIQIGDIYDLPYKDNSFDLVICTDV